MKDESKALAAKIILGLLSILLLFPCYLALSGVYFGLTDNGPYSHEGFIGAGLISFNSGIVWLPLLIFLYIARKLLSNRFTTLCLTPVFILLFCFLIAV